MADKTKPEVRLANGDDARRDRAVELFVQKIAAQHGSETARSYRVDVEYLDHALIEFADEWVRASGTGTVHVDALSEALGDLSNDVDGRVLVAEVIAAVQNARDGGS